jgi:hypothetical protein
MGSEIVSPEARTPPGRRMRRRVDVLDAEVVRVDEGDDGMSLGKSRAGGTTRSFLSAALGAERDVA